MMSVLFSLTVKVSVLLLIALGALPLFRRRSAAFRHGLLVMAVACALVLPMLEWAVPSWELRLPSPTSVMGRAITVDVTPSESVAPPRAPDSAREPAESSPSLADTIERAVGPLWGLGVAVSLMVLLLGLARLTHLARRATVIVEPRWTRILADLAAGFALEQPVRLLRTSHPTLLAVWGWRTATVMVPPSADHWSDARIRVVLSHELAHVVRGDWAAQIAAELLVSVCWFNPLAWMVRSRLRLESERACDDAVLERGWAAADYATHLMDLARALAVSRRNVGGLPASAMARPAGLERRVSAMLQDDFDRRPLTRASQLTIAATLLVFTCIIAGAVVSAQTISSVVGTIFDPTQRVLPSVQVVLTNIANQTQHKVQTDRTGRFELTGVPDGVYEYAMSLPGFSTLTGRITVAGNGKLETSATMQVASLQETIMTRPRRPDDPAPDMSQRFAFPPKDPPQCGATGEIGGNIKAPRKIKNVPPEYPEALDLANVTGVVDLAATIGTDGTIREIRTVSATNPEFEAAARKAVQQWAFTPTLLNCQAIDVTMNVHLAFDLRP